MLTKMVWVRRLSQAVFLLLFLWFCVVSTFGLKWHQWRGWPVNWFLQLDPLVALGTVLTTHKLLAPLLWALLTVVLTLVFGRFFCGWVCPFGTMHHWIGQWAQRGRTVPQRIELNKYRPAQQLKYYLLIALLLAAVLPWTRGALWTGLLDPIPLVTRSVNLLLLPLGGQVADLPLQAQRHYEQAGWFLAVFLAALLANLIVPRFFCRFICPLGALFGVLSRYSLGRIGKKAPSCVDCKLCNRSCEGGCEPSQKIRWSECVLCFNCVSDCHHDLLQYSTVVSRAGEIAGPDLTRRGVLAATATGVLAVPGMRLAAELDENYSAGLIRPPGSLAESEFLQRCLKCGQCMRVCPTNVLQPAGLQHGFEALWTPVLNNRIGSSGCQMNCVACSQICPTAAIRPLTLSERLGLDEYAEQGPVRLGTAFVDRSRCLPWVFGRPCLVCQENCPVSPKAIYTRVGYSRLRDGHIGVRSFNGDTVRLAQPTLEGQTLATGDNYVQLVGDGEMYRIVWNTADSITVEREIAWSSDAAPKELDIFVRLQRPFVDLTQCIGCGICEHECPVSGLRAIRVTAEGESRDRARKLGV